MSALPRLTLNLSLHLNFNVVFLLNTSWVLSMPILRLPILKLIFNSTLSLIRLYVSIYSFKISRVVWQTLPKKSSITFISFNRHFIPDKDWQKKRRAWDGRIPYAWIEKGELTAPDRGPKKSILGPLGRGVLRFSKKAYRNPVHILAILAKIRENLPF